MDGSILSGMDQTRLDSGGNNLFVLRDGVACFRGLPVDLARVEVAGRSFEIARLVDAAALLDDPEIARKFIEEDRAPYGLELWPGSRMLAHSLLTGEPGGQREALEIGTGLGLVAMAAAIQGWTVTATDQDEDALGFARFNARTNGITIHRFESLDWRHPPADRRFQRVFGADVLYQRVDHEPILECLKAVLDAGGLAILADPNRSVVDRFETLARTHGFEVRVEPAQTLDVDTLRPVQGRLFHLSR